MSESVECVVIGAGVVGLAVAREMAMAGLETIVLEASNAIGQGTSSRNSEVIHAGIYYPPGSLKARLCVEGKHKLYPFCDSHGVAYRRCGKLIVATDPTEVPELERIRERAFANGVDDLVWMDAADAMELEPQLACSAALLSPSTGIIDSHGLMLALQGDAESHGAVVALECPVESCIRKGSEIELLVGGNQAMPLSSRIVVNAAGLGAADIARRFEGLGSDHVPDTWIAKGNYFRLCGRAPFSRLIYPVPEPGGLGVHITIDLAGQARFGPDVEHIDDIDFTVDAARGDLFYDAIRRYWPGLQQDALEPDYAGIRPKLGTRDQPVGDFMISGPRDHGISGLVNLFGIESPGLTSSLAIAAHVRSLLTD